MAKVFFLRDTVSNLYYQKDNSLGAFDTAVVFRTARGASNSRTAICKDYEYYQKMRVKHNWEANQHYDDRKDLEFYGIKVVSSDVMEPE